MNTKCLRYRTTVSILKKSSCELFQAFILSHQEVMKKCNKNNHLQVTFKLCDKCRQWYHNTEPEKTHILSSFISFLFTFPCTVPLLYFSFFQLTFHIVCFLHLSVFCRAHCYLYNLARPPQGLKVLQSFPNKVLALPLKASSGTWKWRSMWKWQIIGIKVNSHLWNSEGPWTECWGKSTVSSDHSMSGVNSLSETQ